MKRSTGAERVAAALGRPASTDDSVDEGLWEVAAMVYVGDVYALMVTEKTDDTGCAPSSELDPELWPFIR